MKEIKRVCSTHHADGKATARVVLTIIISIALYFGVHEGIFRWMRYCQYTPAEIKPVQTIWLIAALPVIALVAVLYIRKTLRRRYAYSFMVDYFAKLKGNGYDYCPRCGRSVSEKTGTGTYRAHVGDKVTTTRYSDGSTTTKKEGIYESRSYTYTYHQCSNSNCAIRDDWDLHFEDMPYKVGDLRNVILEDYSRSKYTAGYLVGPHIHWLRNIAIVVLVIATGVLMYQSKETIDIIYSQFGEREMPEASVTAPLGEPEKELLQEAYDIIEDAEEYYLYVDEMEISLFGYDDGVEIAYFVDEKLGPGYTFEFKNIPTDSGLSGDFTIMDYKGESCIFRDEDETIHTPDTEFYQSHYDSIMAWSGKDLILGVLDKIKTGQLYKEYVGMYVLISEDVRVYVTEHGEVRVLDESGDKIMRYIFKAEDMEKPENYANYRLAGAEDTETDPMQKLINSLDYSAYIHFYENEEDVLTIDYSDNGDGSHTFEVRDAYKLLQRGKYVLYPEEERFDYYPYKDEYTFSDTAEHFTAQDNIELYQWLNEYIPANYLRAHMDLDKAKKFSLFGLVTSYRIQEGDFIRANLQVTGDKVDFFTYQESEGNGVKFNW